MSNEDKALTQFIKFLLIGAIGGIIQLTSVNGLFALLKDWKAPLPTFMKVFFNERTLGIGNANWGYVLPFFVSNLLANIYSYIHNMKGNFKTNAPAYFFIIYLLLLFVLIIVATWVSGVVANLITNTSVTILVKLAPTIGAIVSGLVYTLILFPTEKFILFKKHNTQPSSTQNKERKHR